ncbi:MAG: acyl-CoA dehydrogenase [Gammaproteobacteria bacterium]
MYHAPLKDMKFVIDHLADLPALTRTERFAEADTDLVHSVLDEAAKVASEILAPLNWPGDRQGAQINGPDVQAPDGFAAAYQQYVEGGWNSLTGDPEYGGQGLPSLLSFAVDEMWNSANMSFALCPMLSQAGVEALEAHGSKTLQDTYLPKMVSGEWCGTMDLTEPQAGSDLAALRTKAVPDGDHYRITGTKIYISWGDHSMAENIIHMVLARLPDAPDGVRGISLFVVPKYLVNDDGSLGERNDMRPMSIEEKMGIHGSPTCVMGFGENGDGAVGYLVGEPNKGLSCMFTMMNNARLKVGLEGVGLSEAAYQRALNYARDRVQGAAPGGKSNATIIHHPDVRRMLMMIKSQTEAMRALSYNAAVSMDRARATDDEAERAALQAHVDLLVPIVKAWSTEQAQELTGLGVQIHGGMGFVEETGAAQFYRDARIITIYEGTTGIQGQDLAGRKIIRDEGRAARALADQMRTACTTLEARGASDLASRLTTAVDQMVAGTDWLLANYADDINAPNAVCVNLLMLMGTVCGGWQMALAYDVACAQLDSGAADTSFMEAKKVTARFYMEHTLPRAAGYLSTVMAGSASTMALADEQF